MHAITDTISSIHCALDGVVDAQAIYLSVREKKEALREVERAEARLAGLKLKVLAAASDVAAESGHKSAGSWLADEMRLDPRAGRAAQRLATGLDRWIATAAALAAGAVNLDQARVIASVLDEVADELAVDQLAEAEATLLRSVSEIGNQSPVLNVRILAGSMNRSDKEIDDDQAELYGALDRWLTASGAA